MTEQEAIQGIKNEMECVLSEHSTSYFDECLEVAYASMEKQIAKKPNIEGDGYADGYLVYDTWICPNCEKHYEIDYDDYDYCPNCGQKIDKSVFDWGNEDAE